MGYAALPLATALLAGILAARMGGSAVRRFGVHKLLWAIGLLLFSIAAAAQAYGAAGGWNEGWFKTYYLAGGILTVAFLGAGSAWLVVARPVGWAIVGGLIVAVPAAAITVILSSVDTAMLAAAPPHRPPPNAALEGDAFLWAIALNTLGTVAIVGASLWSIRRRRSLRANLLVLAGVAALAGSGSLTRLGGYGWVYPMQMLGLVLLAAGFTIGERAAAAAPRRRIRGLGVTPAAAQPETRIASVEPPST